MTPSPSLPQHTRRAALARWVVALAVAAGAATSGAQAPSDFVLTPKAGENKFRFSFDPIAAWPSTLFWNYNPAGAPPHFADPAIVASAMQSAIGKWRTACDIDAAYAGVTAVDPENSVLDQENGPQPDQVNVLGWRPTPAYSPKSQGSPPAVRVLSWPWPQASQWNSDGRTGCAPQTEPDRPERREASRT